MKTCERCTTRFSEYLDQRLSREEKAGVEQHVRSCPGCARELNELQRAHEALLLLSAPLKPRASLSAVRARIRQDEERRRRTRWLWMPVPVAGAALAGLLAVSLFNQGAFGPDSQVAVVPDTPAPPAAPVAVAPVPVAPQSVAPQSVAPQSVAAKPVAPQSVAPQSVAPQSVAPRRLARATRNRLVRPPAVPSATPSSDASFPPDVTEEPPARESAQAVMVVASRPAVNYCAVAHDPVSGAQVSEVSVRSTYAADGSVRANIVLHFPPSEAVENNESDNSISNNRSGSRPAAYPAKRV